MSDWNTKGFKVGDKVRVEQQMGWAGRVIPAGEYKIIELESDGYIGQYNVRLEAGVYGEWGDITKMTKVNTFGDIKVGDKIRVTRDYNGETVVRTGVAQTVNDRYLETNSFCFYANDDNQTFEVIERPMDPLPTTPGTVILATYNGVPNVALHYDGEHWRYLSTRTRVAKDLVTEWVPAKVVAQD